MQTSYSMKEKYPYWWRNKEKEEYEKMIEKLVYDAEYQIKQYIDLKMKDIEMKIREIESKLSQSSYNIETSINNQPITNNSVINKEIKRIIIEEVTKALK